MLTNALLKSRKDCSVDMKIVNHVNQEDPSLQVVVTRLIEDDDPIVYTLNLEMSGGRLDTEIERLRNALEKQAKILEKQEKMIVALQEDQKSRIAAEAKKSGIITFILLRLGSFRLGSCRSCSKRQ